MRRPLKVLLIGLPHFTRLTAQLLSEHSEGSNQFIAIDTSTRKGKRRFLLELPTADTVFRHWGTLTSSQALSVSIRLRKRVIQFWAGTDVLDVKEELKAEAPSRSLLEKCVHLCESPWTRDELAAMGVDAQLVPLAQIGSAVRDASIRDPDEFSVLGYVGQGRPDFFRLTELIRLAAAFPDVRFRVTGIDSAEARLPANLELLGWVDDMTSLYQHCVAFIRLPLHDGYSFSVREALAWGKYVISSYPYPHSLQATDYSSLEAHVRGLKTRFEHGELRVNWPGRDYVLREFDGARVCSQLMESLVPR